MKKESKNRAKVINLKLILVLITTFFTSFGIFAQSQSFSIPGAGSWVCPAGVTSVTVECWGAGGGGGATGNNNNDKGGGGGGAYARSVLTVVPGQTYSLYVGRGILESDGENSFFGANQVLAAGGKRGANGNGGNQGAAGPGATATSSTGTVKYNGGNAFIYYGGGGAGSNGAGGNATVTGPGSGSANSGGNGANSNISGDGVNGFNYGGGGSGATKKNRIGSAGGGGLIVLSFSCPSFGTVSAGTNQSLNPCITTTTISASSIPNGMSGVWTLISGTGQISNPNSAQTTVSGLTLGQTSIFQWTISNGSCGSSSSTVSITANYGSGCWNYCIPSGNANCAIGDYISRVQLNSIDRYSACENNGYINTGESTTLFAGQQYTLSVSNGINGTGNCAAWIDWNDNGIFESTEYYQVGNNISPNSTLSIPITAGTNNGNFRLRVRYLQNTTVASSSACNSIGLYGETEDYTINVCTLPLQPDIIVGSTSLCAMATNTYTTSAVPGVNYQWNFSGTGTISGSGALITLTPENSGTLSVVPINACGNGPARTLFINVNILSTFATIDSFYGSVCPDTDFTLTASGGIAGTGSQIHWYSGTNGSGIAYGVGNSITLHLHETDTVFIRREGQCNSTGETYKIINVKRPVYAYSLATTNVFCTDVYGWNHWYSNDSIIFSARGNFSNAPAGYPIVTISKNSAYHQNRTLSINPSLCASNLFPGEEQFEMARCWNLDLGSGLAQGTYDIRFYYSPLERQEIENAALSWMASYPDCGYSYKYTTPNGFYWFKNTGTNYSAPQWDGSKYTASDSSANGVNYSQWTGLVSFSGGSGAIILIPNELLPIEWVSFEGKNQGLINILEWQTVGEENSLNFEIQRSADAVNFEIIGKIDAENNINLSTYHFSDLSPFRGSNYYRLKLNSTDGSASYSKIINVENNPAESAYSFYPNPTKDIIYYICNSKIDERLDIKVLNTLGNVVMNFNRTIVAGNNQTAIDLSFLNSGTYLIQIYHRETALVIVEVVNKH